MERFLQKCLSLFDKMKNKKYNMRKQAKNEVLPKTVKIIPSHYSVDRLLTDPVNNTDKDDYTTQTSLFNMGMCLCNNCGSLNSIDFKTCTSCRMEIVIIKPQNERI